MGEQTAIGWTDATWNPWRGCDKVSPGCAHCYMFRDQERYGRDPSVVVRASKGTFLAPLRWREPRMVFTCSWSDWFHPDADEWRPVAWDVIRSTPQHTYQILTKRPERIPDHLPADWEEGWPHVWLGVSIENRRFVGRADVLRRTPAAVRFISAEPLLGPLVCSRYVADPHFRPRAGTVLQRVNLAAWSDDKTILDHPQLWLKAIDWLICGGESGPDHRPMDLQWAADLRDACREAGVAFFMKQDSGPRPGQRGRIPGDLWVHEWPQARQAAPAGVLF